jgi:hypothetical protein
LAAIGSASTSNPEIDNRGNDARHRPHRGRLARSVGPDQRQYLTRLDAKRDSTHRHVLAECLVKILDLNHERTSDAQGMIILAKIWPRQSAQCRLASLRRTDESIG